MGNSIKYDYAINTSQRGVHPKLTEVVQRHLNSPYQLPISRLQQGIFQTVQTVLATVPSLAKNPIIIDSGCGVATSSVYFAKHHPDHWVIGVDKSMARLAKNPVFTAHQHTPDIAVCDNLLLVRADLIAFWWQLHQAQLPITQHYILYPNPWPKPGHLQRRFHAHSIFPTLLSLCPQLELRSNWDIYLQEFAVATALCGNFSTHFERFVPEPAITHFEQKYQATDEPLFRLRISK